MRKVIVRPVKNPSKDNKFKPSSRNVLLRCIKTYYNADDDNEKEGRFCLGIYPGFSAEYYEMYYWYLTNKETLEAGDLFLHYKKPGIHIYDKSVWGTIPNGQFDKIINSNDPTIAVDVDKLISIHNIVEELNENLSFEYKVDEVKEKTHTFTEKELINLLYEYDRDMKKNGMGAHGTIYSYTKEWLNKR